MKDLVAICCEDSYGLVGLVQDVQGAIGTPHQDLMVAKGVAGGIDGAPMVRNVRLLEEGELLEGKCHAGQVAQPPVRGSSCSERLDHISQPFEALQDPLEGRRCVNNTGRGPAET
jgi:hypothetical protein